MKKVIALILLVFLAGCATVSTKVYHPAKLTKEVFVGEVKIFSGIKDFDTPVDINSDARYPELVRGYLSALKKELEDKGFIVVNNPTPQSLVLNTEIGDSKPSKSLLAYTLIGQGVVVIQVEVYQNNELILSFKTGAPYSLLSIKTQAQRLTPFLVKKLKENFSN